MDGPSRTSDLPGLLDSIRRRWNGGESWGSLEEVRANVSDQEAPLVSALINQIPTGWLREPPEKIYLPSPDFQLRRPAECLYLDPIRCDDFSAFGKVIERALESGGVEASLRAQDLIGDATLTVRLDPVPNLTPLELPIAAVPPQPKPLCLGSWQAALLLRVLRSGGGVSTHRIVATVRTESEECPISAIVGGGADEVRAMLLMGLGKKVVSSGVVTRLARTRYADVVDWWEANAWANGERFETQSEEMIAHATMVISYMGGIFAGRRWGIPDLEIRRTMRSDALPEHLVSACDEAMACSVLLE